MENSNEPITVEVIQNRIAGLKEEEKKGKSILAEFDNQIADLERKKETLGHTILNIQGAIAVLEEMINNTKSTGNGVLHSDTN